MSINEKQQIKCPACGELQEMTVWQSITVSDSPDLKEDLLKGKINIFRCASCGQTALVPAPVLYVDDDKRLMITFSPCADADKVEMLKKIQTASRESGELEGLEDYNLRFAPAYNDFLEKLLIFDNGMHDKIIEVLKLLVLMQDADKMQNRTCIFGKKDETGIEFMVQDRVENQIYTSRVPQETYDLICKQLKESGVKYKSFDWELVDREYAVGLLNGQNNELAKQAQ